jgi:outer membrane biosynthesis protein TonB
MAKRAWVMRTAVMVSILAHASLIGAAGLRKTTQAPAEPPPAADVWAGTTAMPVGSEELLDVDVMGGSAAETPPVALAAPAAPAADETHEEASPEPVKPPAAPDKPVANDKPIVPDKPAPKAPVKTPETQKPKPLADKPETPDPKDDPSSDTTPAPTPDTPATPAPTLMRPNRRIPRRPIKTNRTTKTNRLLVTNQRPSDRPSQTRNPRAHQNVSSRLLLCPRQQLRLMRRLMEAPKLRVVDRLELKEQRRFVIWGEHLREPCRRRAIRTRCGQRLR